MRFWWTSLLLACGVKAVPLPPDVERESARAPRLEVRRIETADALRLQFRAPWPATFRATRRGADCPTGRAVELALLGERAVELRDTRPTTGERREYSVVVMSREGERIEQIVRVEGISK